MNAEGDVTTTALRLRACSRCKGALSLQHDQHGSYWQCFQCGRHTYANVPQAPRIRRPEAMQAFYSVFDYSGTAKAFMGLRVRGRLLPPKGNQTTARFDLSCPYANCQRRQVTLESGAGHRTRPYRCKNDHRIYLNLDELTWA